MPLQITQHLVGGLDNNCTYICTDTITQQSALVDPTGDITSVLDTLESVDHLQAIWLTHTHFDHYDGIPAVYDRTGILPIYVYEWGVPALQTVGYQEVRPVSDGDSLTLGDASFTVLHTPGHSPDGCCFFTTETDDGVPALISGDTLFVHGCGRTTTKTAPDLYQSLQTLRQLPPDTVVYPGHNYGPTPKTTIAHELDHNRFLLAPDYDTFFHERFPAG